MNEVKLSGKIYNPKVKFTSKGTAVWEASIGVSRKVKDEWKTEYFDLVSIGKFAEEFGERITDKMKAAVRGTLRQEKWEQPDGTKKQRVRVMVFEVETTEAKKEESAPATESETDPF